MRIFYAFILIGSLFTTIGCKKKNNEPSEPPVEPILEMGVHSNSLTVTEINDTLFVAWDNSQHFAFGSDSLDVDNDGYSDFYLGIQYLVNEDSISVLDLNNIYTFCNASSPNMVFITDSEPMYQGQGFYTYASWLVPCDSLFPVSEVTNWGNSFGFLWTEYAEPLDEPDWNIWDSIITPKYIPFKLSNKHGWIKLDLTNKKVPVIINYAIEN